MTTTSTSTDLVKLGYLFAEIMSSHDLSRLDLWTRKDDVAHRIRVLVSYAEGDDPGEVAQRYIQSKEAANDARGFDIADILSVESTILVPSTSSPLK